ncbi:helix-turn-helix domain-containing protein [Galbibacter pacificus]|uniref:Helix-turn-helix transcriptional regulator n=1 Tax=Galbibacter pacificus TaxID=2996052 RepID=A0ABT6FQ82_9FLAO|nr:helix-turn-helix transcriptional regulator [Galbibacter pacificus]MDG3582100.1 helix-turn-helix transcriptional regulator [Galbibacter pacificus]MDG3585424.1 helix-turn-helix transcriptional regulator [Galbibacter pacificus]
MVNKEEFIERLEKVLDYYDLSASAFADKIGVQRSSISHLLSGRNNPSLDFIMRILHNFPEVELYWLLNGKGSFPAEVEEKGVSSTASNLFAGTEDENTEIDNQQSANEAPIDTISGPVQKNEIARIVVFYKNGTFEEYKNSN